MGFRGEFQGTGQLQDALHQHDHTLDGSNSGRDAPHSRCPPLAFVPRLYFALTCLLLPIGMYHGSLAP